MTYLQKPGSPQEVLGELTHYGIKGMKWGIRRTPEQLGYTKRQQANDREKFKKSSPKRITKSLRKGASLKDARSREQLRILRSKRGSAFVESFLASADYDYNLNAMVRGGARKSRVSAFFDSFESEARAKKAAAEYIKANKEFEEFKAANPNSYGKIKKK